VIYTSSIMHDDIDDNPAATLGRLGGLARAKNLSARQLTDIGRAGASARWAAKPKKIKHLRKHVKK